MDKDKLKQYIPLKKELEMLDKKLEKLYVRQENIPEVLGKVTGSSLDFPYTEVRTTVKMSEPKENDAIKRLIRIKEKRKEEVDKLLTEIEEFIAGIPDSITRQVFELTYIEGKKQKEIAIIVRYSRSRISQIINNYLKD
ncbi:sigma factor-like helix-turn-helix DNA-binding protein [Dorea phocaeensis]|uniref:sigma factor-like helix-turn-helix DNA-binding protein n=1 Tax=Dorea phocaeensis TaxID=2040291 RepID=UPI000C7614A0|nr:sigma factor-like helix-turn-helix DNA-binding protein [Dorea phocaeensis]